MANNFFSTILIFGSLFILPESVVSFIPSYLVPLSYVSIAQICFKKYQEKETALYLEEGGGAHKIIRALGIGVIGLLLTFLIMIVIGFFAFIAMDMMQ